MTLLSIAQNIAGETGFDSSFASLIGDTGDETKVRLLASIRRAGKWLARRHDWTVLIVEHTFTTTATVASYALPADYDHHIDGTLWDRANFWALKGPATPQEWQRIKSGIVTTGPRRRFRVKGGLFFVDPTPAATGETLVYEYVSNYWCESALGAGQSEWAADTDVPIVDADLLELEGRWRFLQAIGQQYQAQRDEARIEIGRAIGRDGGSSSINLGTGSYPEILGVNVPDSGFAQ